MDGESGGNENLEMAGALRSEAEKEWLGRGPRHELGVDSKDEMIHRPIQNSDRGFSKRTYVLVISKIVVNCKFNTFNTFDLSVII